MTPDVIVEALSNVRFPISSEKECQEAMEKRFQDLGLDVEREYTLKGAGRVDFFYAGNAIEVKIKQGRKRILLQLDRYASHPEVDAIILVSATQLNLPNMLRGKPVHFISLGKAWL